MSSIGSIISRPRPIDLRRVFTNENQRYSLGANFARRRLNNTTLGMPRRRYQRPRQARSVGRRVGRARSMTVYQKKNSRTRTGILGGTNADTRLVYRKKSMPRYKRRRWVAFVRKVNAVDERELGTRTVLFNDQIISGYSSATGQGCITLALYGFVNTSLGWMNDLNQIGQLENEANPTALQGATIDRSSKIMFHSAIMDVTIRNTSTVRQGDQNVLAGEAALEMDVYDVYIRKDVADNSLTNASLSAVLNSYDDKEIGGTGTGIGIEDRGASPWEFPSSISRWGVKVVKKTKYFIPNGQTITFQVRDPKRRVCSYGELESQKGFNRPGWTQIKYLVYKLVPGLDTGTAVGEYKGNITLGITRKYMYKVEGFNDNRERLLGLSYTPGNPC